MNEVGWDHGETFNDSGWNQTAGKSGSENISIQLRMVFFYRSANIRESGSTTSIRPSNGLQRTV
jgi:hypothetical protein